MAKKPPVTAASGNNQLPSAQRSRLGLVQIAFWSKAMFFRRDKPSLVSETSSACACALSTFKTDFELPDGATSGPGSLADEIVAPTGGRLGPEPARNIWGRATPWP